MIYVLAFTASDSTLLAAAAVVVIAGIATAIVTVINGLSAAAARREEAAERAEERKEAKLAAEKLLTATEAVKTDLVNSTKQTDVKLDVIHAQGNSVLTASKKSDLSSKTLVVTFMEEMIAGLGRPPSAKTLENLAKAKGQVEELEKEIAERERQQEEINQKIADAQKSGPVQVHVTNTQDQAIPAEIVAKP